MRSRALIHVGGPTGAGKTTLIEQVLRAFDGPVLVARCVQDDSRRRFLESSPKTHSELGRYRRAGASGVALFTFPAHDIDLELVFTTHLMEDYSNALVLEGDSPSNLCELHVDVVPPLEPGQTLLVRKMRDRAREKRESIASFESMLREPDGVPRFFEKAFSDAAADLLRDHPRRIEKVRTDLLSELGRARNFPTPEPTEHWGIAAGYEGIELAQVVVVNIRSPDELASADRLLADLARIRKEPEILRDLLGWRGKRVPITAVAANLTDSKHPGTKKAVGRIRRSMQRSE